LIDTPALDWQQWVNYSPFFDVLFLHGISVESKYKYKQ
jgi:hypothetical protein